MRANLIPKVRAMAHADESPREAAIAVAKLAEAGVPVDPPPSLAISYDDGTTWVYWNGSAGNVITVTFR